MANFAHFWPLFNPWAPYDAGISIFFHAVKSTSQGLSFERSNKKIHHGIKKFSKMTEISPPDTLDGPNGKIFNLIHDPQTNLVINAEIVDHGHHAHRLGKIGVISPAGNKV